MLNPLLESSIEEAIKGKVCSEPNWIVRIESIDLLILYKVKLTVIFRKGSVVDNVIINHFVNVLWAEVCSF